MCQDHRCSDGITGCYGPNGCNGWGAVSPRGGKYRQKRDRSKPLPKWAMDHAECNGTGMRACGCRRLGAAEKAVLAGKEWTAGKRWSSLRSAQIDPPKRRARRKPQPQATPVVVDLPGAVKAKPAA